MTHPIFEASSLSIEEVIKALNHSGCALIKQVFPQKLISLINHRARKAIAFRQQQLIQKQLPEAYQKFYRVGWVPFISIREIESSEDTPYQILKYFSNSCIPEIILRYYNCQSIFVDPSSTVIRRVGLESKEMITPFHQDGLHRGGAFPVLIGQPLINCWCPLNPCGKKSPSLKVINKAQSEQFPFSGESRHPLYKGQALDEDWVLEQFGKFLWSPEYEIGDVMIMTQFTIHKTHYLSSMTTDRLSIEIRSIPDNNLPRLSKHGLYKIAK